MKKIDLNKTIYELVTEYPELVEIMDQLGFHEITKKAMLHSVGKIMTLPKGSKMKNIPMDKIISALQEKGFQLEDADAEVEVAREKNTQQAEKISSDSRTEKLKSYLRRLGEGEDLESVRADFVEHFEHVDATEIMQAEEEIMAEGTPIEEVQKLCDLHSALFHGSTCHEKAATVQLEIHGPKEGHLDHQVDPGSLDLSIQLGQIPGHPYREFVRENESLQPLLEEAMERLERDEDVTELLHQIRETALHYAKKGDLLYPLLKVNYGISGPSNVMWTVDDEIRDELAALVNTQERDGLWKERVIAVLNRMEEMIYKENSILLPLCADKFSEEDWMGIYRDSQDYEECLGVQKERWQEAENAELKIVQASDEVVMPGGHMTIQQLTAMLDTIPLEITFVDADNINRYFNDGEGPKVFKRPKMAIDRDVFSCHPPKIEPLVRAIIEDFRMGNRDKVPVWMEKNGKTMLVTYMAVRDKNNQYLGTLELVQDMEEAKEYFQK